MAAMRRNVCAAVCAACLWIATSPTASAQAPADAPRPVRMMLASTRVALSDRPPHFQLLRVDLAAGSLAAFDGEHGLVFVLAGRAEVGVAGSPPRVLEENEGAYLPAGAATLRATGGRPVTLLHYLLVPPARLGARPYAATANAVELYRSPDPVPASGAGPYELSLTRVTSAPGTPPPPLHQRSTAALYYLLAGTGRLHTPDGEQRRGAGAVVYEPNGFVHTWENVGSVPLVFLQANISREGVPEIVWSR